MRFVKVIIPIITTQRIWATHYKFLNDTSELQLMRTELAERLFPFLKEDLVSRFRDFGIKGKTRMRHEGGPIAIARKEAARVANAFYVTAFEDSASGPAVAVPYITSFCAHTSDQKYEQKNGLLSLWRGYAKGAYAIVFSTKKLCDLYRLEGEKYHYTSAHIGDVVYQGDEAMFEEEFGEGIEKIKIAFRRFLESGSWQVGETFADVLSMFTRLKHRGFFEEREVRSVSYPITKKIIESFRRADPNYVSPCRPMKKIYERDDGVPYIEMFDFDKHMSLPITRIIVGPQENQVRSKKEVQDLVGKKIEVHCSETPLSWPSD